MTFMDQYSGRSMDNETNAQPIEIQTKVVFVPGHSDPELNRFAFGYEIRMTNHGEQTVQLMNRHWRIDMGNGVIQEVRGEGVIGEQPVLAPGETHQYQSGAIIETPAGRMWGDYGFVNEAGEEFRVPIPLFHLLAPGQYRTIN
jgi:ApaG protein